MGKYALANNIIGTLVETAKVPAKSNLRVVDEEATKTMRSAMGAARNAINMGKYGLAANIIATQLEKVEKVIRVVDQEAVKAMLSAMEAAHNAVNSKEPFRIFRSLDSPVSSLLILLLSF